MSSFWLAFVPAAQQHDQQVTLVQVVDPVAGPVVDPQLGDPGADRLDVAGVAGGETVDAHQDPCCGSSVLELAKPSKVALRTTSTMCEL